MMSQGQSLECEESPKLNGLFNTEFCSTVSDWRRPGISQSTIPGTSEQKFVSIVVPCYNEADVFAFLREQLVTLADGITKEFCLDVEFILIDDGSLDSTWLQIREAARLDRRIRGVRLSRNFGHQAALTCGYSLAVGDAVICLDADLQDPPEVIPEMIQKWLEGADVVFAVRSERDGETWFKIVTAKIFYRLIRMMGAEHLREDSGDFRLMSRRSIEALLRMTEQHRFLRGMVGWIGFKTSEVVYHRKARIAGITKYSVRKMVSFAADAIVSFSRLPLRLAYYMAVLMSLPFLAFLIYVFVAVTFYRAPLEPGWLSLITAVVAFGVAILISQAILGEYVGRIYEECKQRPLYIVQELAAQPEVDRESNIK